MKLGNLQKGTRVAVSFEGSITAIEPSGTAGVWLIIANADEGGAVLRLALTDREVLDGGPPSVELGDDGDDGRAQEG